LNSGVLHHDLVTHFELWNPLAATSAKFCRLLSALQRVATELVCNAKALNQLSAVFLHRASLMSLHRKEHGVHRQARVTTIE
jgi:hypothetical protein